MEWFGVESANSIHCVKGEIHNMLTVMRLNARWASGARFRREIPLQAESPLTRGLKALHDHLQGFCDIRDVDTVRYLSPFVAVVRSARASGPLTGAAATAGAADSAGATAADAGSAAGQRGASFAAATAAANHRPTEEIDRDLAKALEERARANEKVTALLAERKAAVRAG